MFTTYRIALVCLLAVVALAPPAQAQRSGADLVLDRLQLTASDSVQLGGARLSARALADSLTKADEAGSLVLYRDRGGVAHLVHAAVSRGGEVRIRRIPMWLSVVPPLVAIGLALLFKEVISSLFFGILSGAFIAGGLRVDSLYYLLRSVWDVASGFIIRALNDSGHLSVVVFSLLVGGMVALISRNGGMAGVVRRLAGLARDRTSAQLTTYLLGVAIFFDDYANTLIVGNTMRDVTDRFGVSREKLAYIVDATAAPIASVAFITTWIGAELDYIDGGLQAIADFPLAVTPYAVFLDSLRFSFYPILTLIFMYLLIRSRRDFGPMAAAEQVASRRLARGQPPLSSALRDAEPEGESPVALVHDDEFAPVPTSPLQSRYAIVPVLTVIAVTMYGLLDTGLSSIANDLAAAGGPTGSLGDVWAGIGRTGGEGDLGFVRKLGVVIGSADSYVALLWASLSGVVVALAMTLGARLMRLEQAMETMLHGFKSMLPALVILTLAWSLASATELLHTADFLTSIMQGRVAPVLLPGIVFVMAALISFSTGSSWSTMAILYPIMIPATWNLCVEAGLDTSHSYALLLNVIATVLSASVLGDHCSPISDTTILSSLASRCDHLRHVATQMPYALTVGAFALAAKLISAFFDGGWPLSLALVLASAMAMYFLIRVVGKTVDPVAGAPT